MNFTSILRMVILVGLAVQSNAWLPWGYGSYLPSYSYSQFPLFPYAYPYYYYGKRSTADTPMPTRGECFFVNDKKLFTCNNGLVTCEAEQMLNDIKYKIDMFGIELVDQQTILLYPKNFTDSSFFDSEFKAENGNKLNFKVFTGKDEQAQGFMVKDKSCFDELVALLNDIPYPVNATAILNNNQTKIAIYGLVLAS